MSKFTLGQRQFPTLGLRSQQPENYVGPTLSCYLGHREKSYWVCHLPNCKGRCIQTADELTSTHEHNHCPDSASIEVR